MALSKSDLTSVAKQVATILKPDLAVPSVQKGEIEYTDPFIKACEERKIKIITAGLNTVCVKGSRGVTEINRTEVELNMIDDQIKNRKNYRTHRKIS